MAQPLNKTATAALIDSNHSVQRSRMVLFIKCAPFVFGPILSDFRAKSAKDIDDETDQQNQANSAAADEGAAKIKPAAAKQ